MMGKNRGQKRRSALSRGGAASCGGEGAPEGDKGGEGRAEVGIPGVVGTQCSFMEVGEEMGGCLVEAVRTRECGFPFFAFWVKELGMVLFWLTGA